MKKILLITVLFLLTLSASVFASDSDWIQVSNVDSNFQKDLAWHYSPTHTKLNPQGRLETWLKSEYIGTESVPGYLDPGDYKVWIVYVNPAFDMEYTAKITEYKKDGTVKTSRVKNEWSRLTPGSNFEGCLQEAYKYAKEHQ